MTEQLHLHFHFLLGIVPSDTHIPAPSPLGWSSRRQVLILVTAFQGPLRVSEHMFCSLCLSLLVKRKKKSICLWEASSPGLVEPSSLPPKCQGWAHDPFWTISIVYPSDLDDQESLFREVYSWDFQWVGRETLLIHWPWFWDQGFWEPSHASKLKRHRRGRIPEVLGLSIWIQLCLKADPCRVRIYSHTPCSLLSTSSFVGKKSLERESK